MHREAARLREVSPTTGLGPMEWIALKHALLSHFPVAAGLLLPWALIAAQRPGRGIRPWWTACRYLGWMGLAGLLFAFASGSYAGRLRGLIPEGRFLPYAIWGEGPEGLLFRHVLLGGGALLLGAAAVWAMNRPRKDHQGIGVRALILGVSWCAVLLFAGGSGYRLAHGHRPEKPVQAAAPAPAPLPPDPEAHAPLRALDYAALESIHLEPVKSTAHGGRWIRAWVSPLAAAAYREGRSLPQGALVVLSTVEDRWGRPGPEIGPLYALEMRDTGPYLTFYWPRVPMERRREFKGESRVYWRGDDSRLADCRSCHATGMADPLQRSRWRLKRAASGG